MKIIAGVASIPDRVKILEQTIKSILPQVDMLHVFLNNYIHIPEYLQSDKILVYRSQAYTDKGDAGKFYNVPENCYYLSIDDDIIYPTTYAADMASNIDKYYGQVIVSHHGRLLSPGKAKSYYKNKMFVHHCLRHNPTDRPVHIGGTGVMGFDTNYFRPEYKEFKEPNMADIWIGRFAQQQKMPILALAHDSGYINAQPGERETIFAKHVNNDEKQTKIRNEIDWILYEAEL